MKRNKIKKSNAVELNIFEILWNIICYRIYVFLLFCMTNWYNLSSLAKIIFFRIHSKHISGKYGWSWWIDENKNVQGLSKYKILYMRLSNKIAFISIWTIQHTKCYFVLCQAIFLRSRKFHPRSFRSIKRDVLLSFNPSTKLIVHKFNHSSSFYCFKLYIF